LSRTGNWIRQTEAYAESVCEAALNVFDCRFDDAIFDSRHEAAIRSWAQPSPAIAAEIADAAANRIAALTRLFERFGYEPLTADVRTSRSTPSCVRPRTQHKSNRAWPNPPGPS
jgi:hypothetical protein